MSKEEFVLVYKVEENEHSVTVDEYAYSLEHIEAELIASGLTSDFDVKYLSFGEPFEALNKRFNTDQYEEFFETYYKSYGNIDVFVAGIELCISIESIEDAYSGSFTTDADFAEQLARDLYDFKDIPSWVEIDWDATSVNIMYDYSEHDGHYFSNYY